MSKLRILIADDHPIVRRGLRSLLETQQGWEVCSEAGNGREAVEQVRRLKPDVAILDITMPELNGLEAARQILKEAPGTEILILTMHYSEQVAGEVLRAGARGFILKSDADTALVRAVEALSRHKPFLTSQVAEYVIDKFVRADVPDETTQIAEVNLTPREREIIQLLAEGKSNKEVASVLDISVKTIEAHRANIMRKLNLHSVSELVRYALRNNLAQL